MDAFVQEQLETSHHKMAVILFPIVTFLAYVNPVLFGLGLLAFCLITSFRLLKSMFLYMLILGGLSVLIPPLAPVILIVMIIFFFRRIGYVIKNWRPFVAGLMLYGGAGLLMARTASVPSLLIIFHPSLVVLLEPIIMCAISFLGLRALLKWLYKYGYNSYSALGIMGSVPIILISFILPFLKLHIGGDMFGTDTTVSDGHVTATGESVIHSTNGVHSGEAIHTSPDGSVVNGTKIQHIESHVRTAPDGDPTNNLSYHGPDAKPVNTQDLVYVHDYIRTVPDGDPTNNLSYNNSHPSSVPATVQHVRDDVTTDSAGTEFGNSSTHYETAAETNGATEQELEITQSLVIGQTAVDRLVHELKKRDDKKDE